MLEFLKFDINVVNWHDLMGITFFKQTLEVLFNTVCNVFDPCWYSSQAFAEHTLADFVLWTDHVLLQTQL